jgi:hypothetical protein
VRKIRKGKALPVTLLIGAGIHNLHDVSTPKEFNARKLLSSWDELLRQLGDNGPVDLSPTMRWELLALKHDDAAEAPAAERDNDLRGKVKALIEAAEKELVPRIYFSKEFAPLRNILAASAVTDVISLNIDLLLEKLIGGRAHLSMGTSHHESSVTRKYVIDRSGGAGMLRVWHPHGDRSNKKSLTFGRWRYEQLLGPIGKARANFKKAEREHGYGMILKDDQVVPKSWVELVIQRPLVIVGTSLHEAEWDLWYALLIRWRNFAKRKNAKSQPSIWVLEAGPGANGSSSLRELRPDRFKVLDAPDWPTAWRWLAEAVCGDTDPFV